MHNDGGRAHSFTGKKEYVLLVYLSIDRKKVNVIKDFDTWEETEDFEKTFKTKKRTAIFYKIHPDRNWYTTFY